MTDNSNSKSVIKGTTKSDVGLLRAFALMLLLSPALVLAHGEESHDDASTVAEIPVQLSPGANTNPGSGSVIGPAVGNVPKSDATNPDKLAEIAVSENEFSISDIVGDLSLSDFPTLHPLVVHVTVTSIPIALLFSLLSFFLIQRTSILLALGFTAAGLLSGYIAAFPLHPHTTGLSQAAKLTLQKHDFFAYSTLGITSVALVLALICAWRPNRLSKSFLAATLLLSTLAVAVTGHYGGTLAYVHGIGIKGQFLSTH